MLASLSKADRKTHIAVIGASGGIGSAFVSLLAEEHEVTALSRLRPDSLPRSARWHNVDLLDEASIQTAAKLVSEYGEVDAVIIASGILHDGNLQPEKDWRQIDANHMQRVFAINTIGPALVIRHFAPLLPRGGKSMIAALSARVGSIADNHIGGWYAYRASKAALNQIIRTASIELARKRKEALIIGLHPGTVATELSEPFQNNRYERFSPEQSARYLLDVMDARSTADSGRVFDWQGKEVPA